MKIKSLFNGENIQTTQSSVRIGLYFHDYKLAIDINENGHSDVNTDYEKKNTESNRTVTWLIVNLLELILTKKTLISANAVNDMCMHIKQSSNKLTNKIKS